ncbi:fibronectin type III domain-containing protein 9 [Heterodontus francisci]|uniref:fibronectin type III domain-containing protein 9 n=1 Tax=Heterodontus francisci TaxID=7792 RepID=UPI00355BFBFF
MMGIVIQNISSTSAIATWSSPANCANNFYSIMYHPKWKTLPSGYSRKIFQKEERVPISQNWLAIEKLTPLTMYILCITCLPDNPTSEQCTIFSTSPQNAAEVTSRKKDLALGIWMTSSVLLLIIAGVLLYGCLHIWCCKRREHPEGFSSSSDQAKTQAWKKRVTETALEDHFDTPCNIVLDTDSGSRGDTGLSNITENPFTSKDAGPLNTDSEKLSSSSSNKNNE